MGEAAQAARCRSAGQSSLRVSQAHAGHAAQDETEKKQSRDGEVEGMGTWVTASRLWPWEARNP